MPTAFANGLELYYEEFGEGTPIVFLSGLGGDSRAFAVPLRAFAKTHRAIAIDNRDVGRSGRVAGPYSTADMADDAAALMEAIGLPRAHVVGQSLGGLIAQQVALRHPGRVRSLTLVSSHAGAGAWKKAVVDSWIVLKRLGTPVEFTQGTLPWLVAPAFYRNTAMIEGLVRFAERNPWPQEADAFERQAGAVAFHEVRERLPGLAFPTLVLSGELDLVNPVPMARELADLIPGAIFEVMPGVGHLPHVEDNAGFQAAILRFLEGLN